MAREVEVVGFVRAVLAQVEAGAHCVQAIVGHEAEMALTAATGRVWAAGRIEQADVEAVIGGLSAELDGVTVNRWLTRTAERLQRGELSEAEAVFLAVEGGWDPEDGSDPDGGGGGSAPRPPARRTAGPTLTIAGLHA